MADSNEESIYRVSRSQDIFGYVRGPIGLFSRTADIRLESEPASIPEKMEMLPATAEAFFEEVANFGWEGVLKLLLTGTRDKNSTFRIFRDHETTLVREVYSYISNQWARHVKLTIPAALVGQCGEDTLLRFINGRQNEMWQSREMLDSVPVVSDSFDNGFVAFSRCGYVDFPEPAGRNVNMMPFIFGDKESLPDDLQCYYPLIQQCPYMTDDTGEVGYLTVHESY
eukprot:scaffold1696_cov166-Cylindrotheca_fusiformis.AAC.1